MKLLRRRKPARTCPLCREDLGEESATPCGGCGTIYHDECLSELGNICAVPGCDTQVDRQHWPEELELGAEPRTRPRRLPEADPARLAASRAKVERQWRRQMWQEVGRDLAVGGVTSLVALAVMLMAVSGLGMAEGRPHALPTFVAAFLLTPPLASVAGLAISKVASGGSLGSYGPINALIIGGAVPFWLMGANPVFVVLIACGFLTASLSERS